MFSVGEHVCGVWAWLGASSAGLGDQLRARRRSVLYRTDSVRFHISMFGADTAGVYSWCGLHVELSSDLVGYTRVLVGVSFVRGRCWVLVAVGVVNYVDSLTGLCQA